VFGGLPDFYLTNGFRGVLSLFFSGIFWPVEYVQERVLVFRGITGVYFGTTLVSHGTYLGLSSCIVLFEGLS
jgi:hypothetical protein